VIVDAMCDKETRMYEEFGDIDKQAPTNAVLLCL